MIKNIVIVGGGTAGWMAAAALARFGGRRFTITLVESEDIGTIGVGEATIPQIRLFNDSLGIREEEFVRETKGSFKLAIEFVDWLRPGVRYFHGFGAAGRGHGLLPFHHYWLRHQLSGGTRELSEFSPNLQAAKHNLFGRPPSHHRGVPSNYSYAYHFDAGLYAAFLRRYAEKRGVRRVEGKISTVSLNGLSGHVDAVHLDGERRLEGDFFLDCSGFRGILIQQALKSGFEDWSHWLPANSALAVPCESVEPLTPYTRATARDAGWQWRIPLQHRIGNGYVYCNDFVSDDQAATTLIGNLDGAQLAEPRQLRFKTGKRRQMWKKNCVALGLASGFIEPLESTSIHLVQTAIARLLAFLPSQGFGQADIDEYNMQADFEYASLRDFIILHYHANQREGSEFWRYCREMKLPDSLAHKIALFQSNGRIQRFNLELFDVPSWLQVMWGQGLRPRGYHTLADNLSENDLQKFLIDCKEKTDRVVGELTDHRQFVDEYCRPTASV